MSRALWIVWNRLAKSNIPQPKKTLDWIHKLSEANQESHERPLDGGNYRRKRTKREKVSMPESLADATVPVSTAGLMLSQRVAAVAELNP